MLDGGGDSGGAILGAGIVFSGVAGGATGGRIAVFVGASAGFAGIFFSGVAGGSTGGRIAVFVGASVVLAFAVFAVSPATAASKAASKGHFTPRAPWCTVRSCDVVTVISICRR